MSTTPPPRPTPSASRRSMWIVAAVLVAVALLAAIAVVTTGGDDTSAAPSPAGTETSGVTAPGATTAGVGSDVVTAPLQVTGNPLPPHGDGDDDAVGTDFPTLSGTSVLGGAPLTIGDDGKAKLILFLAHWCPHCQREVPAVLDWLAANPLPDNVELYAVSTAVAESRGNFPPADWLREAGWTIPTLADNEEMSAFNAAGLTSFPSFVVVSADGTVAQRRAGELSDDELDALVARALA